MYNEKTTKEMKKLLSLLAVAMVTAASFTSCLSDNDDDNSGTSYTGYITTAYLLNAGAWHSGNGSLTKITGTVIYNPSSVTVTSQNLQDLGELPNDIMIYGNKLYIVSTGTNTVYVYDKNSMRSITQLSIDGMMGDAGQQPRCITGAGGNIYVTTYGVADGTAYSADNKGYVAAIDTTNFSLKAQYQVGAYPEDIVAAYNSASTSAYYTVYVANSDYGQGNGSISVINFTNGTASSPQTKTYDNIKNPTKLGIASTLWIQESATYEYDATSGAYAQKTQDGIYRWDGSNTPVKAVDAAIMAPAVLSNGYSYVYRIYYVSDPYGTPSYGYYDISSGSTTTLNGISGINSPCAMAVDSNTGYIYIGSSDGQVNVYSYDGTPIKVGLTAGSYPTAFAFDTPKVLTSTSSTTSAY